MPARSKKNKENKANAVSGSDKAPTRPDAPTPATGSDKANAAAEPPKNEQLNSAGPLKESGDDDFKEAVEPEEHQLEEVQKLQDREEGAADDEENFEEARDQPREWDQADQAPDAAVEAVDADEVSAAEEEEDQLQKEEERVEAELEKLREEAVAASRSEKEVEIKPPDPALNPPAQARPDWDQDMSNLRSLLVDAKAADEEKIRLLHDALVERIEDIKNLDEHKATAIRRLDDAGKERDRCKGETQRAIQAKTKLEGSCRELQAQKTTIAKENRKIEDEEQSRHSELKAKFEQAIKDVQEKMDAELEVRQHFLKENEELRGKLLKFTETYEAQETQLAEQRVTRETEMEVAQKRLEEHETMCAESKVKSALLEKQNEALRKSQAVLRTELQTILGKFDEFHEAVTGSNTRHGECKVEIDTLQTKLQGYETENADLKANQELAKATEEQKVAEKQRDALERLCDNLQKENKKLQEQAQALKRIK